MPVIPIDSLDDPRVESYRNLKLKNLQRGGPYFIAEGKKVVERLLESDFETHSVFISRKRLEEWEGKVPADVPLYVADQSVMSALVGFDFHVGVVGCGVRRPSAPLEELLPRDAQRLTVVACPNCDNPENMGAIVRIGAAFGIDALLLGKGCCDPFGRRVIRVSMGATFSLPIFETDYLLEDLRRLKQDWNFQIAATVLDTDSELLETARRPARFGVVMGNEDAGLDQAWTEFCDRKLTIPMCRGTDSLNVAVASGIILHHFTRASADL
ncbi:TrmH family RNA methyltransferase [Schlesneria paludicola]|uniref:TrmH family RNA methyltransferase n=1 Tax=Schlesneria paludicola TaxID=360056 RepID=UPI00029AE5CD|nr:RNA methyltransferase [Schlesneria paludicola]